MTDYIEIDNISLIRKYYLELEKVALVPEQGGGLFLRYFKKKQDKILVSNSRIFRGIAKLCRIDCISIEKATVTAQHYFALQDAFILLAKKQIPVYFYNRVGKMKEGYEYSDSAKRRMNLGLNFPTMYENIEEYEDDLKEIYGDKYSRDYVAKLGKIPQVVCKGDHYCHYDYQNDLVNVIAGKRVTCYQPEKSTRTIHLYGRCGVFGYAVEDADTLPSQLQKLLIENGHNDIRVVNHGLWGGTDDYIIHNFLIDSLGMNKGDIVLFYQKHFDKRLMSSIEKNGVWYAEITAKWHENKNASLCFFDRPGHMNAEGYNNVAKIIYEDLLSHKFENKKISEETVKDHNPKNLTSYIKSRHDSTFKNDIELYIEQIKKGCLVDTSEKVNGAIVMNCNPFTKGHRYLIEYALQFVNYLYIFVVEEDYSFFKYEDRFEMVTKGTADIKNVIVVPSGKFIISAVTFPEYFMKDYVKEKSFDASGDIETFCKYIAPPLGIKIRFAGEEPFDPVTLNYNNSMRKILPEFGMIFREVPRLKNEDNKVVNATEVRRLLKEGNFDEISKYVPDTTLQILMSKYS